MAGYDASVRVKTDVDAKRATVQLASLENRMVKTADKVASLRSKMDALKDAKIPTKEYENLQSELDKATKELEKMVAQDSKLADIDAKIKGLSQSSAEYAAKMKEVAEQKIPTKEYSFLEKELEKTEKDLRRIAENRQRFLETGGKDTSNTYKKMEYDLKRVEDRQDEVIAKMKRMEESGKAFTLGTDTEQYKKLSAKYESVNAELEKQKGIHSEIAQKQADAVQKTIELNAQMNQLVEEGKAFTLGNESEEYKKLLQQIKYLENELQVLRQKHGELTEEQEDTTKGYKKLGDTAKKALSKINSMVNKAGEVLKNLGSSVKSVFSRLNKSAGSTDKTFTSMGMSLKNILKYGFGIRSLYALVNKLRSAISEGYTNLYKDNERFKKSIDSLKASTLTLKNALAAAFRPLVDIAIPYIQKVIDYMSILLNSVGQFLAAITGQKTYTRAIRQTTAAIEDQNKAQNKQLSSLDKLNNLTSGSRSADAGGTGQMFEEVPIDDYFSNLADRVKDLFSKLFAPLKKAWEREGKFVMDSWKYALGEIKDLAKSIGSDFLEVWQQEKTIKIFEDILHIIGDIGLAAGNLAHNFRLAWEENETGKRILEGVRDIVGVIIANIRHAADVTADWSSRLNFTPLLTAIKGWVESLVPVFDALSGIVTDFYEKVLLPLGKWTIEKGLPELFQVLTDFNNKVDWESLRAHLAEFWEHLEPFAETIGEGLIIFIERVTDRLADFLNSDTFVNFLHNVEEWMDSVTPEDVADGIELLVTALLIFKGVAMGLSVISTISSVIGGLATAFSLLTSPVGLVIAAIAALAAGFAWLYTHSEGFRDFVNSVIDGIKMMIDWFKNLGTEVDVVREKVGASRSWAGASSNIGSMRSIPRASTMSLAASLQDVEIPGYATGQVIPRTMKQHLAYLGDNNKETEVVSPLSTMKQAMMEAMAEAGMAGGNSGDGGDIVINIDGREVFRVTRKQAQEYKKRTGNLAFG